MKILLGSQNSHKLRELQTLLPGLDLSLLPEQIPESPETGQTFADNARQKSEFYARQTGQWVLADDSGLSVKALQGAPGVLSARYAGLQATDEQNNLKLLTDLKGISSREAQFVCVMSLASPKGEEEFQIKGFCEGRILESCDGSQGFGYDPLFFSFDLQQSFGLAPARDKNKVSHRAKACALFLKEFTQRYKRK